VHGSKGVLEVDDAFSYEGLRLTARIEADRRSTSPTRARPLALRPRADHFARCILENKEPKSPGEEGGKDMKLMMEIYESCKKSAGSALLPGRATRASGAAVVSHRSR